MILFCSFSWVYLPKEGDGAGNMGQGPLSPLPFPCGKCQWSGPRLPAGERSTRGPLSLPHPVLPSMPRAPAHTHTSAGSAPRRQPLPNSRLCVTRPPLGLFLNPSWLLSPAWCLRPSLLSSLFFFLRLFTIFLTPCWYLTQF